MAHRANKNNIEYRFQNIEYSRDAIMPDINPDRIPRHVAIIMDGNGRWAKKKGFSRVRGHEEGTEAVRVVVRESRDIGIKWLTLYAFSEENWKRPRYEIDNLMGILKRFLKSELNEMLENR